MNGVLIDSNVLIDIITEDSKWFSWSADQLEDCASNCSVYINKIIYAEVSIGYKKIEDLENALSHSFIERLTIPWEAAFLAGKAYLKYRRNGGIKTMPLPDFFIGAHALISNLHLLTRDSKRFKHYFPQLKLITPT